MHSKISLLNKLTIFLLCIPFFASAALSVEEKVGQLLMAHFNGDYVNEEASRLIKEVHIGGIIYYNWSNSLSSPKQVTQLSQSLQQLAQSNPNPIPLLIAVDQEGGPVSRLQEGFTVPPSNQDLGITQDLSKAETAAFETGQELLSVGINVNFAPGIDIKDHPRSYSSDPARVLAFASASLKGYQKAGIIPTLKHFPGLGDASIDPHIGLPILHKSLQDLQNRELIPFQALKDCAPLIMTAHLFLPLIDPINCATFSKPILDLLRHEFNGVIISDSLIMQGALDNAGSIEEACLKAFHAGCDILLLGGKQLIGHQAGLELSVDDVIRIHQFLVDRVKSGEISVERMDASVQRILILKNVR